MRGEQEEVDALILIPVHDFRDTGKRRIINDDAAVGVVVGFVITARPEGADDGTAFPVSILYGPVLDGFIHDGGV